MDPHIFVDPDPVPGSPNLVDPMDPDRKHCLGGVVNSSKYISRDPVLLIINSIEL